MRRLVRVVLALCLFFAPAAPAHAARWWGWLDELSGPGPFSPASVGTVDILLPWINVPKEGKPRMLADQFDERKLYVSFEKAFWDNQESDNFSRQVGISTYQFIAYVPLSAFQKGKSPLSAFDAGIGIGLFHFSGDGIRRRSGTLNRVSIPIRLKITPSELVFARVTTHDRLRRFLGAFSYRIGWDSLPGSFDNRDFVGPDDYHSDNDWLFNQGVVINVIQLLPLR